MKVLYYIEKRLSDRYKDHECHWFVNAKPLHARDFSHVRLHYIKDYGYSIYKEITKKQYKNFKVG